MYEVVHTGVLSELIDQVNEMIAQGWDPAGGLGVTDNCFYQAMCLKLKPKEE